MTSFVCSDHLFVQKYRDHLFVHILRIAFGNHMIPFRCQSLYFSLDISYKMSTCLSYLSSLVYIYGSDACGEDLDFGGPSLLDCVRACNVIETRQRFLFLLCLCVIISSNYEHIFSISMIDEVIIN